ncbi:hypothetical protein [Phenylobacterium sp.]|jgi:hypothetical protein|uniref:hypothetical protein n=1 Tax=Phenylobacterium sp. TaxID=1871053 RepID=UPI002F94BDBF
MSAVRFVFPKPRLGKLLKLPGGLPVAEAVARAKVNLETIRPTCIAELETLLDLTEARLQDMGEAYDDAGLADLYGIAVRGIGGGEVSGVPAVDAALTSLCDLLDHLRTARRYDRSAIAVHVQAWRVLMGMGDQPGASAVVDGLKQVSARFAAA